MASLLIEVSVIFGSIAFSKFLHFADSVTLIFNLILIGVRGIPVPSLTILVSAILVLLSGRHR